MPKPIITVFGATGAQGGGLVRALLGDSDRHFAVRAVTRKPDGAAARQLVEAGAEVVLADLDDGASVLHLCAGRIETNILNHPVHNAYVSGDDRGTDGSIDCQRTIQQTVQRSATQEHLVDIRQPHLLHAHAERLPGCDWRRAQRQIPVDLDSLRVAGKREMVDHESIRIDADARGFAGRK